MIPLYLKSNIIKGGTVIKKKSDLNITEIEGLRGGVGKLKMIEILSKDELQNEGKLFSRVILEKNSSIGLHRHVNDFEVYYILKGIGLVEEESGTYTVNEGDVVYTCDGEQHSLLNVGDSELEMLAVVINNNCN